MKRDDVLAISPPETLAAATLFEEADPGQDVMGIGTNAVQRTHPHAGTFPEEAIQIGIVAPVVAEDEGNALDEFRELHGVDAHVHRVGKRAVWLDRMDGDRGVGEMKLGHGRPWVKGG